MRFSTLICPIFVIAACGPAPAQKTPTRTMERTLTQPVRIGLDGPNDAACTGEGTITARIQAVRNAPKEAGQIRGRLERGQSVIVCEATDGWQGIVYPSTKGEACGVDMPVATKQRYAGPCLSGWVPTDSLTLGR